MPSEMKLWQIEEDVPREVSRENLDLESRLEDWLCSDISLIGSDLLVIGRQVRTVHGGFIDLLAVDPDGNLVVLELKRDKTPRDIVAQALDYASWVQDLSHEEIVLIAAEHLGEDNLEESFRRRFQNDLPEVLNERHRIYIVASALDSATERIVRYLSETHDVDINVATFAYFRCGQQELLGRSMLLDEDQVQDRAQSRSKRAPKLTWEEFHELAKEQGVGDVYDRAMDGLQPLFDRSRRTRSNVALVGSFDESKHTVLGIYPGASSEDRGLAVMIYIDRLCEYFGLTGEQALEFLGKPARDSGTWDPNHTWFFDRQRLEDLIEFLSRSRRAANTSAAVPGVHEPYDRRDDDVGD